jgi:hypothetical protein
MAAGSTAALIASFFVAAMVVVWFKEKALLVTDRAMLAEGVKWLLGSGLLVGLGWWLRKLVAYKPDDSFRLVESGSGRLEKLVQNVSGFGLVILLVSWLWALDPGSSLTRIPKVAGWILLGFLGLHVRIALHEMGHLAAACLVRLSPRKIQVGVGPPVWSRAFANGLLCEWRAWPHGGFVLVPDRRTEGFRIRQFLFIAAGPLTDFVILWSAYQVMQRAFGGLVELFLHGPGGLLFFSLFWLTVLSALGGLIPRQTLLGPQRVWTDGYLLLQLWTGSSLVSPGPSYHSNWREPLALLGSDGARSAISSDESPARRAGPLVFQEQRALLNSRLLRRSSFTSGPPV